MDLPWGLDYKVYMVARTNWFHFRYFWEFLGEKGWKQESILRMHFHWPAMHHHHLHPFEVSRWLSYCPPACYPVMRFSWQKDPRLNKRGDSRAEEWREEHRWRQPYFFTTQRIYQRRRPSSLSFDEPIVWKAGSQKKLVFKQDFFSSLYS